MSKGKTIYVDLPSTQVILAFILGVDPERLKPVEDYTYENEWTAEYTMDGMGYLITTDNEISDEIENNAREDANEKYDEIKSVFGVYADAIDIEKLVHMIRESFTVAYFLGYQKEIPVAPQPDWGAVQAFVAQHWSTMMLLSSFENDDMGIVPAPIDTPDVSWDLWFNDDNNLSEIDSLPAHFFVFARIERPSVPRLKESAS